VKILRVRRSLVAASVVLLVGAFVLVGGASADADPLPVPPLPAALGTEAWEAAGLNPAAAAQLEALSGSSSVVPALAESPPTALAIVGFAGGLSIGQLANQAFVFDLTGGEDSVCAAGIGDAVSQGVASVLTGANCTSFNNTLTAAQQNVDQAATSVFGSMMCTSGAPIVCVQLQGAANPSVVYQGQAVPVYCFSETGDLGPDGIHSLGYDPFAVTWSNGSVGTGPDEGSLQVAGDCAAYGPTSTEATGKPTGTFTGLPTPVSMKCAASYISGPCGVAAQTFTSVRPNPNRQIECDLTGSDGVVYPDTGPTFTETDAAMPSPVCATLPSGVTATHETLYLNTPSTGNKTTLYSGAVTAAYAADATAYPACATGACTMELYSLDPTAEPCTVGGSCEQWFTDPNKNDDYECEYGPTSDPTEYTPPLSECNTLSNYYQPAKVAEGDAFANPSTGADTGTTTSPDDDSSIENAPAQDLAPDGSNAPCFPSGWSAFNPLNWVVQPGQCLLRWAFVPRESVLRNNASTVKRAVAASGLGAVLGIINGMENFPISGSGCSGIAWDFKIAGLDENVSLLAACPGDPLAATAGVVKTVLTAVVITAGVLTSARYLASLFGYVGFGSIVDADRREAYRDTARERGSTRFR
jgi:hypothetical protein